jgi:hypothetical protein
MTLDERFKAWSEQNPEGTLYQAFQAGMTEGAVSLRRRAMDVITKVKMTNDSRNLLLSAIGELSDLD